MSPVIVPTQQRDIRVQPLPTGRRGGPSGRRTTFFFDTFNLGTPRLEDLRMIRLLESNHTVSIPMDTIKTQIAATKFVVRPTVDNPSAAHLRAAEDLHEFLLTELNGKGQSFDAFMKEWVNDVLSIDSGVVELVPEDDGGFLQEAYVRDGATFVKALDEHDRLPPRGSSKPAYWQFSLNRFALGTEPRDGIDVRELLSNEPNIYDLQQWFAPIPFSRDQIIFTQDSPRPYNAYGLGRLQKARRLIEILLNEDRVNLKFFSHNEYSEGALVFEGAEQTQLDAYREYWTDEVKGQEHVLPMLGHKASFVPFRPNLSDLQFLDSQKWFHKLVWWVFGLNQNEIGDLADVNRATAEVQDVTVFRRTTRPLLDLFMEELNRRVLPHTEPYARVNGELEFAWEVDNPAVRAMERREQESDLNLGLVTVNEVRQARGNEEVEWGGMPLALMQSVARTDTRWALEHWADVAPEDLPDELSFGFLAGEPSHTKQAGELKEALRDTEDARTEYPKVAGLAKTLQRDVAKLFLDLQDDLAKDLSEVFPEERPDVDSESRAVRVERHKQGTFSLSSVIDRITLGPELTSLVTNAGLAAMAEGAKFHARRAADEINQTLDPADPEIEFNVQVEDTFAARRLAQEGAKKMRGVEEDVKREVRDTLIEVIKDNGTVEMAREALQGKFEAFTTARSRLIARTEVLSAARGGAQAFAETTDLIAGKEWIATGGKSGDGRTRAWHAAMHGTVVPKDSSFTVPSVGDPAQPSEYPKSAFIVGEDQPYHCRCDQRPVLADDMPDDIQTLCLDPSIQRKESPVFGEGLSDRQYQVLFQFGQKGESLNGLLKRLSGVMSRKATAKHLGVSKATLYQWLGAVPPDQG